MKIVIFLSFLFCSCLIKGQGQATVTADSLPKMIHDTVISKKYDTIPPGEGYNLAYEQDSSIVALFRPYFEKSICKPGDYNNPVYLNFMEKGAREASAVQARFENLLSRDTSLLWRRTEGRIRNLENCRLRMLPVYYLSANVVLYKRGDNLTDFFTLDTTVLIYKVVRNNKVMALIESQGASVGARPYSPDGESLNYDYVQSLRKEPIAIDPRLQIPGINTSHTFLKYFAYVKNDHLIIVQYSKYDCEQVSGGYMGHPHIVGTKHVENLNVRWIEEEYKYSVNPIVNPNGRIDLKYAIDVASKDIIEAFDKHRLSQQTQQ